MLQSADYARFQEPATVDDDDRDGIIETLADEMYHKARNADESDTRFAAALIVVWSCDDNAFGSADLEQAINYMRKEHARRIVRKNGSKS